MLKRVRFFFSANLVAVLLASALILSEPAPVKACPVPAPATLLALYLRSDLIFTADITSEKDGKILIDEEGYFNIEVLRNLKISSVLKGKPERNFVFTGSEYRNKKPAEETTDEMNFSYAPYEYKGYSKLKVGERYLFFFKKDSKTGQYVLTDSISGYKKLSDADLYIHKKRLNELKLIVKTKENQLEAITEWLVRLLEEPATRWDGVSDLRTSFEALEYEDKVDSEEKEPFVIDKDFNGSAPEIARQLSDSQKEYISSLVFSSIHQEMSGEFYYGLGNIIKHWDKSRLAMYAFSLLQTADKSDAVKVEGMMRYISRLLDDEELFNMIADYPVEDASEQNEEVNEEETAETADESENPTEEVDESVSETEQINDIEIKKSVESEQKTPKLTLAQKREKVLQDFINRYEYLLARGFPVEVETEDELAEK